MHLVVEGSSQWVIGRNVTLVCSMLHRNDNRLQFPSINGVADYLTMKDADTHSYIMLDRFTHVRDCSGSLSPDSIALIGSSASASSTPSPIMRSLHDIKRIIDLVHNHVCGHASYGDIRTLLQRNKI